MAGPYLGLYHKMGSMTPLTATLPFNRDCIGQTFEPAKRGGALPDRRGHWLIVQDQGLVVSNDNHELALPFGDAPAGFEVAAKQALLLGTWRGEPCWVVAVARGDTLPAGYHRETCVPMQGTKLPDDLLSLGGMAMQALWWESTSGHCPRCGEGTTRIQYVGSQNWPFPSQLMVGFVAEYAGGEIAVDKEELEDARWFPRDALPVGPARHSIARFIIEHYARRR